MLSGQCRSLWVDPLPPRLIGRWVEVINEYTPPEVERIDPEKLPKGPNRKVGSSSSPTVFFRGELLNVRGAVHLGCDTPGRMQPSPGLDDDYISTRSKRFLDSSLLARGPGRDKKLIWLDKWIHKVIAIDEAQHCWVKRLIQKKHTQFSCCHRATI